MTWDPPLPNPAEWRPRRLGDSLRQALQRRCLGVEELILLRAQFERQSNIDNFDSGPGLEDIFREELARILPHRYSVRAGVVSNSAGQTVGDCDVVLFNDTWFPEIKAGATVASRRYHFPIEGVYGVLEVKQSLTESALDEALEKLVKTSRLAPSGQPERLVENRDAGLGPIGAPPFTAIVAAGLGAGKELDDLVHRFVAINGQLPRRDVVNALCVLGVGFLTWSYKPHGSATPRVAEFSAQDDHEHLSPTLVRSGPETSALYELVTQILGSTTRAVLAAEDVAVHYGAPQPAARPESHQWDLHPDGCTCYEQST